MKIKKHVEYFVRNQGFIILYKQWKKLLRDVFWGANIIIDGGTKTYPYLIAWIERPKEDPWTIWKEKRELYYRKLLDDFSEHFIDSVIIVLVSEGDIDEHNG